MQIGQCELDHIPVGVLTFLWESVHDFPQVYESPPYGFF